jgi:Protein of unknown function (DUF1838)
MDMDTTRRMLLAMPGALALGALPAEAALAGALGDAVASRKFDFDDPQSNLDALIRIFGSTDGRVRYNIGYGRAFALFDGELAVPLFDAKAVQWVRFKRRADGSYDRRTGFVQLHEGIGGTPGDDWKNPVTGEAIKLPIFTNDFNEAHYTVFGVKTPPEMDVRSPEPPDKPRIYPWLVLEDDVWLSKEDFASYMSRREGRRLTENSTRIYHTSLKALAGSAPSVPATMIESALSELFGWMKMPAGRKGVMLWRFTSKKYDRIADLPTTLIADVRARAPKFMEALSAL